MNGPYRAKKLVSGLSDSAEEREYLNKEAGSLKRVAVHDRFLADCELLAVGALTPLSGFMNRCEVDSVVKSCRFAGDIVWGIPIVVMISEEDASSVMAKEKIVLADSADKAIAVMEVSEKYKYPKDVFCKEIFKTADIKHPGVKMMMEAPEIFLGGSVKLLNRPARNRAASPYYLDPSDTRKEFEKRGWRAIAAFHTRNPIHRAHEFMIKRALEAVDGALIHPLVGETKPDDVPAEVRIRCYEGLIRNYFNPSRVTLAALPTFMRFAGPREALNHAIMRRNYGCTHFIIGRDHAGVGNYYGRYEAQDLLSYYAEEIGMTPLKFENVFYCRECEDMATSAMCSHSSDSHLHLSGTKIRDMVRQGVRPPLEFSRREVVDILTEWAQRQ